MNDKEYYLSKNLYEKILKASNVIAKSQRNPPANFMVTNSEVADVIFNLQEEEKLRAMREKKLERILKKKKDN